MENLVSSKTRQQNSTILIVFVVALLFTSSVLANRPAMNETSQAASKTTESSESEKAVFSPRPEPLTSSVEIIMQQQNQQRYQTGDVLQLPPKEMQPGETINIKLLDSPRRGMSMDNVQATYGHPVAISESVGEPPITHWTYDDRIVFFEYSTVIHAVAR